MSEIEIKSIGIITTEFEEKAGIPIQAGVGEKHIGKITLDPKYSEGLKDLDGFSHVHLLYHFNRHDNYSLVVKPYMDDTERGLFSTRAPKRPNPIGLSLVEVLKVESNTIIFRGVDILNNTPLIDIKPYYHDFDSRKNSRAGWLDQVKNRRTISDDRF